MKILFVVAYAPSLIRTRPLNLIKALASNGHRITLATLGTDAQELKTIQSLESMLDGLIAERIHISRSLWNCVRTLPGSQPLQANFSWSPQLAKQIAQRIQKERFDAIHVEHLRGARYAVLLKDTMLRKGPKNVPLIWDSVDCISDLYRYASQNSYTLRWRLITAVELPRTDRYEGWLANQFDRIVVTSESDRSGLMTLADKWRRKCRLSTAVNEDKHIAVVPNGVDLSYFSPSQEIREAQTLVITGKMSYHANVTAVARFVQNVMPKIWKELPQTKLWVVGKRPPSEIQRLGIPFPDGSGKFSPDNTGTGDSRIQITGTVDDIRPFLRRATLAVAPIQYAVGIQNKVLEAMACGTPVVATPEAVRALAVVAGRDLVVANGDQQLAESILNMLKNPGLRSTTGSSGRDFVESNHNWRIVAEKLAQIYQDARN